MHLPCSLQTVTQSRSSQSSIPGFRGAKRACRFTLLARDCSSFLRVSVINRINRINRSILHYSSLSCMLPAPQVVVPRSLLNLPFKFGPVKFPNAAYLRKCGRAEYHCPRAQPGSLRFICSYSSYSPPFPGHRSLRLAPQSRFRLDFSPNKTDIRLHTRVFHDSTRVRPPLALDSILAEH